MLLNPIVAALHLLGLGVGLGAIWARARALRPPLALPRLFAADSLWGVAAAIWLGTGLWRLFALEKGFRWYLEDHLFRAKMALFVAILLLEIYPMVTLIRWRGRAKRGEPVDPRPVRTMRIVSWIQTALIVGILFVATAMARGFGH
jgi:putative membrane protein